MNKPKVLHISTVHKATDNRILFRECMSISEYGFDIYLLANNITGFQCDSVKIIHLDKLNLWQRLRSNKKRILNQVEAIKPDIIHLHDPELMLLIPILKRHVRVVIYDMHEWLAQQVYVKPWIPKPLKALASSCLSLLQPYLLKSTPVIYAETSYIKEFPKIVNYQTILNLPRTEKIIEFQCTPKLPIFTVAYMGQVTIERGCLKVAEILLELKQKFGMEIGFICVGECLSKELKGDLDRIGDQLDFYEAPGFLPFFDGIKVISKAHVGVSILDRTPNYTHSFSTKIFEYIALGMPFIASDFPINRKVKDDFECGILVNPDDKQAIINALLFYQENNDNYKAHSELAINSASKVSWSGEADKLVKFYKSLLGS